MGGDEYFNHIINYIFRFYNFMDYFCNDVSISI